MRLSNLGCVPFLSCEEEPKYSLPGFELSSGAFYLWDLLQGADTLSLTFVICTIRLRAKHLCEINKLIQERWSPQYLAVGVSCSDYATKTKNVSPKSNRINHLTPKGKCQTESNQPCQGSMLIYPKS